MIYWYSWGNWEFDIRIVRDVLGLPREHPDDDWFNLQTCDPEGSFERIVTQLQDALTQQGKRFFDVVKAHDLIILKEGKL
jgi:hypothetical protein